MDFDVYKAGNARVVMLDLPGGQAGRIVSRQLMRAASSVAANYRAACRAHSRADFIAELLIVEEEADEALFWLEMLEELELGRSGQRAVLADEADQLVAIIVASKKTARQNR